jgi:hypothetical protein
MLESLHLRNVGPAPKLDLELGERLNLITGDNGLGKSFLLDVAWWALTRKWPHDLNERLTSGYSARPADPKKRATIGYQLRSKEKAPGHRSTYVPRTGHWRATAGRPFTPGLVVYAHADGGFSVWDPVRNFLRPDGEGAWQLLPAYVFAPQDVWEGLRMDIGGRATPVCNGLLADWAGWIRERGADAKRMEEILARLAPKGESIHAGPLMRLAVNDARDIPSIRTPYSPNVPILHASAGIRRIVGLAYMLMWSWNEHIRAAEQTGEARTRQVLMIVDEIESHLHPRWQRSILGSLLHIAESLRADVAVQLIASTHSPLILASAEPTFDQDKDAWFDLDLEEGRVHLRRREFVRRGDVSNWLTSEAFDLKEARSLEAEEAITDALDLLRERHPSADRVEQVDKALRATLGDIDRFWVRWDQYRRDFRGRRRSGR